MKGRVQVRFVPISHFPVPRFSNIPNKDFIEVLGRSLFNFVRPSFRLNPFAFQTNNRQVVSGAANGGVRVWDVINGECLQHLRGHVKSVTSVACTAEHLLSVSLESVLCIWDRSRGECMHRLKQVRVQCFALYSVKYARVRSYALCLRGATCCG